MKPKPNETAHEYLARIGRKGGSVRSEAKTKASRERGALIKRLLAEYHETHTPPKKIRDPEQQRVTDALFYKAQQEHRRAYLKRYYQTHREQYQAASKRRQEKRRAYAKRYYQTHREQSWTASKRYRETHREERRARRAATLSSAR